VDGEIEPARTAQNPKYWVF